MNLKSKKIIAREFLFFLLTILLGIIFFLFTFAYNRYYHSKVESLNQEISLLLKSTDSLSNAYKSKSEKQQWFADKFEYEFSDTMQSAKNVLWKRLSNLETKDSLKIILDDNIKHDDFKKFVTKIGFSTSKDFRVFVQSNIISPKEINAYNDSIDLLNKIAQLSTNADHYEHKNLNFEEQLWIGVLAAIFLIIPLFLFRYLFFAVKWSIKVLRNPSE
jgi:hypothetical protein